MSLCLLINIRNLKKSASNTCSWWKILFTCNFLTCFEIHSALIEIKHISVVDRKFCWLYLKCSELNIYLSNMFKCPRSLCGLQGECLQPVLHITSSRIRRAAANRSGEQRRSSQWEQTAADTVPVSLWLCI